MKAKNLSLNIKILGVSLIIIFMVLIGLGIMNISMSDVVLGVGAMEALVLPIDISKIKTSSMKKVGDI